MRNLLRFALLLTVLNGCSKSPDIDPRDQYIGDYNVIYTATGTSANGQPVTLKQAGTMTVVKESDPRQIAFVEGKNYLSAALSGSAFTLTPVVSPLDKDFVTTGSGTFTKNSFTFNTVGKGGSDPPTYLIVTGTKR